ncbi:rRNA maturation RNase YbeY [Phocicoccus pinnipedialis]|uniref:Endoribonuclease YbeY n=2 Tax=Phocicoccus pinnipedialis TaxID=110845 RepID=A0A6V7RF60_9BACL|nr:putative rRNA maturation factor [Jeotgalicoccus pinnipedialis]CAD2076084.1 Endoribonuclease YbeY [Jeotgalicoccus pinnipedialis]
MMITIDFTDRDEYITEVEEAQIDKLLNFAYNHLELKDEAEVSVSFVSDSEIQEINRNYREKNEVTDVISFAFLDDEDEPIIEGMPSVLGDIIINTNRAREQATEYGHSYEREIMFLSLHGFLHLLGFDHMNEEEEKEMFGIQKEILDAFGIPRG